MIIEMQQAMTPDDVGEAVECGICGIEFETEPVLVSAATDAREEIGYVCCPCVLRFGEWKQEQAVDHDWPTSREYREAVHRFPEPMFASGEELERADTGVPGEPGDPYLAAYIHRDRTPRAGSRKSGVSIGPGLH